MPPEASGINGYRLYRFISPEQHEKAVHSATRAWQAYYSNRPKTARKLIRRAYLTAPGMGPIYEAYVQICRELPPELVLPPKAEAAEGN